MAITPAGERQQSGDFGTSNPGELAATTAAHAAGLAAAEARFGHYEGNIHGLGAAAGDPKPSPSTQQPSAPPPPDKATT